MNGRSSGQRPEESLIIPNVCGASIPASRAGGLKHSTVCGTGKHADEGREKSRRKEGGLRPPSDLQSRAMPASFEAQNAYLYGICKKYGTFWHPPFGWHPVGCFPQLGGYHRRISLVLRAFLQGSHILKDNITHFEGGIFHRCRPFTILWRTLLMILIPIWERERNKNNMDSFTGLGTGISVPLSIAIPAGFGYCVCCKSTAPACGEER